MNYNNYIGNKFGKLTIIDIIKVGYGVFAKCKCDCGREATVLLRSILKGSTCSCGCKRRESLVARNTVHGMSHTRIYRCWASMIYRCENPKNKNYHQYGGKGIKVCSEWHDFLNFMVWADCNGYADNLTIDRIDSFGNYCPENCRWVTIQEQQQNKCTNNFLTFNGETHSIADWSRKVGIDAKLIWNRLSRGKTVEEALTKPPMHRERYLTYKGITDNIVGWARRFNFHKQTLYTRLSRNNFDLEYVVNHFGDLYLDSANTEVTK